jgi:DNA-binding response OmpR family regulator
MSQTVLIIDDSVPMHALIKALLSEEPVELHSAYNGTSGLVLAASLKPDLILLDVDMPAMNGFEVCKILKASEETVHIPIIFLTACASADEKVWGFELKASDYITKPFEPSELWARVRATLRTKRLLDLLPNSRADAGVSAAQSSAPPRHGLNPKLSMQQLVVARSENPWGRVAPKNLSESHNLPEGVVPPKSLPLQGSQPSIAPG